MNPVCIWNRAFRWLFAITTFFFVSQFHVKYACAVSKNVNSVMQFQKTAPVSCADSKNHVTFSVLLVKPSVILQKKKHDYQVWFWKLAKKLFFELQNVETLATLLFLADFLKLFFFCQNFFKIAILNQLFM